MNYSRTFSAPQGVFKSITDKRKIIDEAVLPIVRQIATIGFYEMLEQNTFFDTFIT
jgi:hypothetical protein